MDKLVGEKSPNLFLLGRVEDQGTLLEENSYHIKKKLSYPPTNKFCLAECFDVAKNQRET